MLFIIDCFSITVYDVIRPETGTRCVDDYNEFYFYKKDYEPLLDFGFPGSGSGKGFKIWFLPGQKNKLLKKMRDDINSDLTKIIADNSDSLKDYEISDDYKKIYIYYFKEPGELDLNDVKARIQLYYEFVDGHWNTEYDGDTINFVEVEK